MIPEAFIQDLLARVDIVDLIDAYVPLKKAGANYAACCPFHNEKSPSFTVSPNKQFYHCFGCGAHGTAISFLMEYQGLGFIDAIHDLAKRVGLSVPETRGNTPPQQIGLAPRLLEIMARAAKYYREQLKQSPEAIAYLKQRGLTGEIAAKFGIGYAPNAWQNLAAIFPDYDNNDLETAGLVIRNEQGRRYDRFRERVMFPIINPKGEVIAFGGRVIGLGEPKYLNSPETPLFEKGREVFGLPQARAALREHNTVIVVEGYMDVVALAQHGVGHAVATLGTATTTTHVQKLLRQVDKLVFCFDGDNAGRKAAWRALENALEALSDNKRLAFAFLPESDDPDSYVRREGAAGFLQLLHNAAPLSDFLLRELGQRCDLTQAEGKAQIVHEAKPLLHKLNAPLLRLQLVKRLAEASGFSQQEVERLCQLRSSNSKFTPPARSPRRAPSLNRTLLRLVLQRLSLLAQIPVAALAADAEGTALQRLATLCLPHNLPSSYPALCERLRGQGEEALIETLAAEALEFTMDEEEIEMEFAAAVAKLADGQRRSSLDELQAKAKQFGVAGLSAEEKQRYLQLLTRP